MKRENVLDQIKQNRDWDILVIGGGASGLGIALEACTRGYKTLLVEQSDFAKSTSSKSTKLVHGGVRYLTQGNVKLVREAAVERGLLYKNAPHLVKNLQFIIPLYNFLDKIKYTVGLKLYDWISGSLSLGSSVFIDKKKVVEHLPTINQQNLIGGVLYHDGQFDDARLAIALAQTIFDHGGFAINYMQVNALNKSGNTIVGAELKDLENGGEYSVKAKVVINATGVFADDILRMDEPEGDKTIAVSQGVHIVIDKKFLPGERAMMIPKTSDGRVLFVLPWHNKLLAGTTDTPVNKISLEPVAQEEEIDFILENAAAYLTEKPGRNDILSIFAGLRPLAATKEANQKTKEISRSHRIIVSPSKMFTILGGKWTTYRKMGEDMISKVERVLNWQVTNSTTASLSLTGKKISTVLNNSITSEPDHGKVNDSHTEQSLSKSFPIFKKDVILAVEEEMAITTEDVLSRRTRLLLLDAGEAIRISEKVSDMIAVLRNKNEDWKNQDTLSFRKLAENYIFSDKQQSD